MIRPFGGKTPQLGDGVFVAPSASVIGDVAIGARSTIWYGAVLRGDVESIRIGSETSIQDNTVIHVDSSGFSTVVGDRVTVGHSVVLHGCRIGDETRVGPYVEIQRGVVIGARCKIQSHAFICSGVELEDEVFVGHGTLFINDKLPRATTGSGALKGEADWELQRTVVERSAALGSGVVVLGGVRIGAGALARMLRTQRPMLFDGVKSASKSFLRPADFWPSIRVDTDPNIQRRRQRNA